MLESNCRIMAPMQRVHRGLKEFMSRIVLSQIAFDYVPVRIESSAAVGNGGSAEATGGMMVESRVECAEKI